MKRLFTLFIMILMQFYTANSQYWKEITNISPPFNTNYWLDVFFHPSNPNYGWVCGFNGMVIRTTDGGNNWSGSQVPTAYHLEHIHFPTLATGYTSGPDGIFKTTNGGVNWTNVTPDNNMDYWGCYFVNADVGLVLSGGCVTAQRFYRTTNGGASWTLFTGNEASSGLTDLLLFDPNGLGYAVSSGKLWRTTDGGVSWAVFATSGTNVWNEEITNVGSSFLLPFAGVSCSGQGNDGGMRFTTDLGNSWKTHSTGVAMFGSYLIDATRGWACGDGRSVYYTSDAGENWVLRNCGIRPDANLDDIWFINENTGFVVGDGVYKLNAAENTISKDTLLFNNLCLNENKIDSVLLNNLSFSTTNVELSIVNDLGNNFRIINPSPVFAMNACNNRMITVGFFPNDENSHSARLRVVFNPGTTNELIKFVELIGIVRKSTNFPQDTLIVINSLNCGVSRSVNLPWFASEKGESIIKAENLSNSLSITYSGAIPQVINTPVTNVSFNIKLQDTGWHQTRIKFTTFPCNRDTFVTIRAYGVSPIISHAAKLQLNSNCLNDVLDTIRIYNTGNDILKIGQVKIDPQIPEFSIIGWVGLSAPIAIKPFDYADIIIRYKPNSQGVHLTRLSIENNDSTKINGEKNPYLINLKGISSNVELTDTLVFDFGDICLGDQKVLAKIIGNYGNLDANLSFTDVINNVKFTFSDINSIIKKNDSITLTSIFEAKVKGKFNGITKVISNPCNREIIIKVSANVIQNELEILPDKISGVVKVGEFISKTIRINSKSNFNINIKSLRLDPPNNDWNFSFQPVVPMLLLPNQGADFTFRFEPLIAGKLQGKIVVETDGLCPEIYYIDVDLSSFSRFVDVTPNRIDFGKFLCRYDEQINSIKVSNLGFQADTITELSFDPVNNSFEFVDIFDLPYIIQPNQDLEIKIKVNNQLSEGIHQTTIKIKTIGDDGQSFEIPVKFEFYKSSLTPKIQEINFGDFELCSLPLKMKVGITNVGTLTDTIYISSNSNEELFEVIILNSELLPGETDSIEITFDPRKSKGLGDFSAIIKLRSKICDDEVLVNCSASILKPIVSVNPQNINFGTKWTEETIKKSVRISLKGVYSIIIDKVELSDDQNFRIINSPIGNTILNNQFLDFDVEFFATIPGAHSTEITLFYSSDCRDSIKIQLEGIVRNEKYVNKVYIDYYEAMAGDLINIYVKLSNGEERLTSDRIDFEISFDKNLFYPNEVLARFGDSYREITYSYNSGKISGFIVGETSNNILKKTGEIIKIHGLVLASIPDTTILEISKFDVLTDKNLEMDKENGLLRIVGYCPRTTELSKFIMMPRFKINSGNITTNGFLNFNLKSTSNVDVKIKITDINGISFDIQNIMVNENLENHNLNLSNYPSGIYFMEFESKYQKEVIQIINL